MNILASTWPTFSAYFTDFLRCLLIDLRHSNSLFDISKDQVQMLVITLLEDESAENNVDFK